MTINQISVFLENKPGQLAEFTRLLRKTRSICALFPLPKRRIFGILRLIVDDPYKTVNVVKDADYICAVTPVLAVELSDKPGSLVKLLTALGEGGINVEYSYAFTARKKDVAYMVFRVNDPEKAVGVLIQNQRAPLRKMIFPPCSTTNKSTQPNGFIKQQGHPTGISLDALFHAGFSDALRQYFCCDCNKKEANHLQPIRKEAEHSNSFG